MAIRISKVTRELNVGASTLVEFLHKKGFGDVTEDLNQKLTDEQYNLLVAEFSQDKTIREEANRFLQDRQSRKTVQDEPVQEEKPAPKEPQVIETVVPEEPVIKFKTVGKIKLDEPKSENPFRRNLLQKPNLKQLSLRRRSRLPRLRPKSPRRQSL